LDTLVIVSIRFVLLFGFCGLLAVSIAAVTITGLAGALGNTLTLMARDATQMVDEAERRLEMELRPIESQAAFIAERFETGNLSFDDPVRLKLAVESSAAALPDLAGMMLIDRDGLGYRFLGVRREPERPATITANFGAIPWVPVVLGLAEETGGAVWRAPAWVPEIEQTVVNYHTPLYARGRFVGLLIQGKAVADLSDRLRDLQDSPGKVPFLLYDHLHVLAHPGLAELALDATEEEPLPPVTTFQDAVLSEFTRLQEVIFDRFTSGTTIGRAEFRDESFLFAYRDVGGLAADRPITVGIYVNEARYVDVRDRLRATLVLGVAIFLVAVPLALWVARRTAYPIQALAAASEKVEAGELDSIGPLPRSRMRELNEACRAFERMVAGLRERERIMDLFGRVVPKSVAEILLRSPEGLKPQESDATVLFCDLEGFTRMTNELGPEKVVHVLNAYFTDMVDIVHAHNGIVTQFQGDAVLAVFNLPLQDPNHAGQAVAAAIDMRDHLATHDYQGRRLRSRIGIATGPLIAANVGAASRMNYTVHGDTVNLASRLEAMNKETDTTILIGAVTAARQKAHALRSLGVRAVRGQGEIEIFTPEEEDSS
jgi:adenylate cyclase